MCSQDPPARPKGPEGAYLIVGCGAVGGGVAGSLPDSGADVVATSTNPAVRSVVAERGLHVQTPDREFRAPLPRPTPRAAGYGTGIASLSHQQ